VVVVALEDLLALYLPLLRVFAQDRTAGEMARLAQQRAAGQLPLPDRLGYTGSTVLSLAATPHVLRRTAPDAFELLTPQGTLFDGAWAQCLRAPELPLGRGSVLHTEFMTATVRDDRAGRPTRVEFHFDRPLEDPSLVFLVLRAGRMQRLQMPAIGSEIDLPRAQPSAAQAP
jgi:hypothetical protein